MSSCNFNSKKPKIIELKVIEQEYSNNIIRIYCSDFGTKKVKINDSLTRVYLTGGLYNSPLYLNDFFKLEDKTVTEIDTNLNLLIKNCFYNSFKVMDYKEVYYAHFVVIIEKDTLCHIFDSIFTLNNKETRYYNFNVIDSLKSITGEDFYCPLNTNPWEILAAYNAGGDSVPPLPHEEKNK